jgi:hypothetical protein
MKSITFNLQFCSLIFLCCIFLSSCANKSSSRFEIYQQPLPVHMAEIDKLQSAWQASASATGEVETTVTRLNWLSTNYDSVMERMTNNLALVDEQVKVCRYERGAVPQKGCINQFICPEENETFDMAYHQAEGYEKIGEWNRAKDEFAYSENLMAQTLSVLKTNYLTLKFMIADEEVITGDHEKAIRDYQSWSASINGKGYASNMGPALIDAGFVLVSSDSLEVGDVAITQSNPGQNPPTGDIAIWDGKQWISDDKQIAPPYVIYRRPK